MALAGMENHVYKFENIIRKQKSGGPIGLSLTGDIADCYLIGWDKKFREKLKVLRIEEMLYDRYKDDITIMADSIEKGSRFENDKIIQKRRKLMQLDTMETLQWKLLLRLPNLLME